MPQYNFTVHMSKLSLSNWQLLSKSCKDLSGKWLLAIIWFFVISWASVLISSIIPVFLLPISILGLTLANGQTPSIKATFGLGFKRYLRALGIVFFFTLFEILLGLLFIVTGISSLDSPLFVLPLVLLFIVTGIIASLYYSQVFYILAEDKSTGTFSALTKSKSLMRGYKWQYFKLGFLFIGLFLLCLLTLGIGFLWFIPLVNVAYANFYRELKQAHPELPVSEEL